MINLYLMSRDNVVSLSGKIENKKTGRWSPHPEEGAEGFFFAMIVSVRYTLFIHMTFSF